MIEFMFNLIIQPLCLMFEFIFDCVYDFSQDIIFSIFLLSFVVSIISLPLYLKADKIQQEEKEIQKKLAKKVDDIKKNFKNDERFFLLQTYYRQNGYNPIMAFRGILGLLLQIPIFLAAYILFSNLQLIDGASTFLISDLSKADALLRVGKININVLPFLMTIVNLIAGLIYLNGKDKKEKRFLIIISLVFFVLLYNSPSALVLYWTFNNLFSLIKNLYFRFGKKIKLEIKDFIPNYNYNKIYLPTIVALWIIIGLYIPSNILSASPYEFLFENVTPNEILIHVSILSAGIFLFWGNIIYCFSNNAIRKIYTLTLNLILFFGVAHLIMYKMPSITLTNTLSFSGYKIDFFAYNKFYLFFSIFVLLFVAVFQLKNIFSNKFKTLKILMTSIIVVCVFLSFGNIYKISSKTRVYLNTQKTEKKLKDKYINLSKDKKNVLIIFADRAITSYIPIIFNEKPELSEKYKGFTYYANTLSYAQYTLLGYPPILGGYEYTPLEINKKKGVFEEKFAQAITMLPAIFGLNDWSSNVINPINEGWESQSWAGVTKEEVETLAKSNLYKKFNINVESIPKTIGDEIKKEVKVANSSLTERNLICYSFLLISPLNIRGWLYENGMYHNPNNNTGTAYPKEFLKAYAELNMLSRMTDFSANKNTFTVYNNSLTHYPSFLKYPNYVISLYDDHGYEAPMEKELNQWSLKHYHANMALIRFLGEYFDFLRKNNVYDNTRIIIVSDHGIGYGLQNPYFSKFKEVNYIPYNALLMVKDFNQKENIKMSFDFMTNAKVPYIATKNVIKNPKNPFSGKSIVDKKETSIVIKADELWQPVYYLGKEEIFDSRNRFSYVKNDPLAEDNWILDLKYKDVKEK